MTLEDVLLALQAHACQPHRAGRSAWRSDCPSCLQADALGLNFSALYGLSIAPRCGCSRAAILDALGLLEAGR